MKRISDRIKEGLKLRDMTQKDLVDLTGIPKSNMSQYANGKHEPKQTAIYKIAMALNVNESWLMGFDVPFERQALPKENDWPKGAIPIEKRSFPLLGSISCGEPVFADQDFEGYVIAGANIQADYCIRASGDSMKNARIFDGDIVFIRQQPDVDNGEIAAVLVNDDTLLKRVYKQDDGLLLIAENPDYPPQFFKVDESETVRILGKAIAFQSDIR